MTKNEHDPVRIQLIVGVLGFVGVVIAALLGVFAPVIQERFRQNNQPSPTPIVIVASPVATNTPVPTDTVPPGEPTSTPAPTDTPAPTATFTPVPLPAGEDWLSNCISTVWQVFPADAAFSLKDGCYQNPLANVFSSRSQRLEVFYQEGRIPEEQVVGIFVQIPSDSLVEFTVHPNSIESGELWMGVMGAPKIDNDTRGLILGLPEGNVKNSAFVIHPMPEDKRVLTNKFKRDDYLMSFDVTPTKVTALLEKYISLASAPVSTDTKWLFFGYKATAGNSNLISGYFSDLVITPR